jgi:hypothetical protein
MPLTAAQLAKLKADAAAAQASLTSIDTQIFATPLNPAAVQAWGAKHAFDLTALTNDIGALVADPTPPPPPPPPTGKPVWGEYHAGSHYAFTPKIMLDYAYNNASTFPQSVAQSYTNAGYRLMLKVGALTPAQATAIAQALVGGGQANAIVPIMWEGNQGVNGWETAWNENADTATQFVALFNSICAAMRAVPGAKFTFAWCPNLNQAGNQKTGRTQFDTFPGTGVNGDIVVAPDGYDNPGDTGGQAASVVAQCAPYEQLAAANGAKFAGLCECGDNASDDPTYWSDLLAHATSAGWEWVVNFQATTSQGGSFNSVTGPNSIAAIKAFYAA